MFKFGEQNNPPEGYRTIKDEQIMKSYLKLDMDGTFEVSKNEWMLAFIKLLGNDMAALEKDGPDSIMKKKLKNYRMNLTDMILIEINILIMKNTKEL